MRRRAVLAGLAAGPVGGCVQLAPDDLPVGDAEGDGASADVSSAATRSEWTTSTDGDADAVVRSASDLYLRVHRCSDARAAREYAVDDEYATVSFDYEVEAEGWWEKPYVRLYDDGEVVYDSAQDPIRRLGRSEYDTTTGSFETTVWTTGTLTVEVGVERSDHCSNGDHANTYFRVAGLEVAAGNPDWQTNRTGSAAALVRDGPDLHLRVYRCATARAVRRVPAPDDEVTVSFDYEVEAEGWWEKPYVRLYDGERKVYDSSEDGDRGIAREEYETRSGSFEVSVAPDSDLQVVFSLEPSPHCSNRDHANTHFRIEDFAVE